MTSSGQPMRRYTNKRYLHEARLFAYLEQFKYVDDNDMVLEIGGGGGAFSALASRIATIDVADFDAAIQPDHVVDITRDDFHTPFVGKYDKVFCCQVLEHIPFARVRGALSGLCAIGAKQIVLSLPDNRRVFRLGLELERWRFGWVWYVPGTGRERSLANHPEHHWEIYSGNIGRLLALLRSLPGYSLLRHYPLPQRPYQHFFILQKAEVA